MTRRGNIQHAQRRRRMSWSVKLPITILVIELAILAVLLPIWIGAVTAG